MKKMSSLKRIKLNRMDILVLRSHRKTKTYFDCCSDVVDLYFNGRELIAHGI